MIDKTAANALQHSKARARLSNETCVVYTYTQFYVYVEKLTGVGRRRYANNEERRLVAAKRRRARTTDEI